MGGRLGCLEALSVGVFVGPGPRLGEGGWIAGIGMGMPFLMFWGLVMRMGLFLALAAVDVLWVVVRRRRLEVRAMTLAECCGSVHRMYRMPDEPQQVVEAD